MSVERGCGRRVAGAIYGCTFMGGGDTPLEHFLVDPPIVIDPQEFGLSPVGVKLFERDGVWHILDWVGGDNYKNVADMIEEIRRFGLSRRLSEKLAFSKLTEKSKIFLVHARGHIENYNLYERKHCPKFIHEDSGMCIGFYWHDLDEEKREMPAFTYYGKARPKGVKPIYKPAIFAALPLHALQVVKDTENHKHERAAHKAQASSLPVEIVEE